MSRPVVPPGLAVGFGALFALRTVLEPMMFQTKLLELPMVAVVAGLGLAIAVVAAVLPVRAVLGIDAMAVLREQ